MDRMIERSAAVEVLGDERGLTRPEKKLRLGFIKNINALPPARFTREDVEKAAAEVFKITWKRECYNGVTLRDVDRYRNNGPESMGGRVERYEAESVEIATAALSAIGDVDHG